MPEKIPFRIRFLNLFRNIFRLRPLELILLQFTNGKGYDNVFVKCIPQNYQYARGTFRTVTRKNIVFRLDLSEYMEWVIFWGLNVEERDYLYPHISPGMVILDIGSNIGETLLNFSKITGERGHVYGFEPVKYNFEKCKINLELNNVVNASLHPVALSDKSEVLYFEESDNHNSGGIYMQKESLNRNTGKTDAITMDEFLLRENPSKVDFIKIDTEGFEMNVLRGGLNSIRKFKPVLFVEIDNSNLARQNTSASELIDLIVSCGYTVRNARQDADMSLQHFDLLATPNKS